VGRDAGAAIIPAAINHATGQAELLGDTLFDYRDVLTAGDPELLHLAWQKLADSRVGLQVLAVEESAVQRWKDFPLAPFARAPQVDRRRINENEFRSAHTRLGRQMRRLHKLGVSLHVCTGEHSKIIRHLYECKRAHFAAASDNLFRDERRCEFMVAAAALEDNGCEVFTLETEAGTLVSGMVTFRDGGMRRCYTTYFHPEWARHSPGVALLYEVTARSLAAGLGCDYLTGEYPYKLRLANSSRALYRVELNAQQLADITAGPYTQVA